MPVQHFTRTTTRAVQIRKELLPETRFLLNQTRKTNHYNSIIKKSIQRAAIKAIKKPV